jgi:glycosyltransferase involved in cell wall biosynthesis
MTVSSSSARLAGSRVLVLNWRDVRHPDAGGAEQYMHQIGRRWVQSGTDVTWFTARAPGLPPLETLDMMRVERFGGPISLYPLAALRMLRTRGHFDAVVDCQNGVPFFSPLFAGRDVPVVQVVHHVHQDQFATRFGVLGASVGRLLEGRVARRVYADRPITAVSPSTRSELRRRLGFKGPILVVPNGTIPVPTSPRRRASSPTVVVVSRLVPHKRLELLLGQLPRALSEFPELRVEIVGDGPERERLQGLVADLTLQSSVTFHGRLSDDARDRLLSSAWLTACTSAAEGWGCAVLEAAAWGVPCLALRVPGISDSVMEEQTGWLVDDARDLGSALLQALGRVSQEAQSVKLADACQAWARCFSWDRSAELLAGVLLDQMGATAARLAGRPERRRARSDIAVLAQFRHTEPLALRAHLRCTDEISVADARAWVLLNGCDEFAAAMAAKRLGASDESLHLVDRHELLAGPAALMARDARGARTGTARRS